MQPTPDHGNPTNKMVLSDGFAPTGDGQMIYTHSVMSFQALSLAAARRLVSPT